MAWIASLSQDGCDYARIYGSVVKGLTGSSQIPYVELGFNGYREASYESSTGEWTIDASLECSSFDGFDADIFLLLSKYFSFASLVLGGGGALFLWFTTCFVFGKGTWRWAGYEVLLASLFQASAFIWFYSSICKEGNSCFIYFGSFMDIIAAVLWFLSAVAIFMKYPIPSEMHTKSVNTATDLSLAGNPRIMNHMDDDDSVMSDPDPGTKFPRADIV